MSDDEGEDKMTHKIPSEKDVKKVHTVTASNETAMMAADKVISKYGDVLKKLAKN